MAALPETKGEKTMIIPVLLFIVGLLCLIKGGDWFVDGYIKLGQPSTTLSGGESQRVKLATELAKKDTGNTIYILDEPTTGLHFEDIRILMQVIHQLVQRGNTAIIIEHNLDVIKQADYILDLGPDGGRNGGELVAEGTPEEIVKSKRSLTAKFLKQELE